MSYPLLRIARDYAHVEVRIGKGAQRWEEMRELFSGPADRHQEWKGGEGDKLSARHCMWPSDPGSTLSLPYTASGVEGLAVGKAETLSFPSGVFASLSHHAPGADAPEEKAFDEQPLLLHEDPRSGNCYKIKLTAALLGLPLAVRQYDILKGETRTAEFTQTVNAHGRIPVLQIGDRFLPESNAACWYLAEGSELIPQDRFTRADMLRWMFFEQYSHEPNIATLRFWLQFVGEANLSSQQRDQIQAKRIAGQDALELMEAHLAGREWMAGDRVSLADVALYPYTHLADAGGFALADFKSICAWVDRFEALERFVPMG